MLGNTTKNIKNRIVPYVPIDEKLFKKFCCVLPSLLGKVNRIITYKKAKTVIIIVSNIEYPKYFSEAPPGLIL